MGQLPNRSTARRTPDPAHRVTADRQLQAELDKTLARLCDASALAVDLRLAQVLSTVLEPAWGEHVSFQEEALFPILGRRAEGETPEVAAFIERLSLDHAEIGTAQRGIIIRLDRVVAGATAADASLAECVRRTLSLRQRHHDSEAALATMLPASLDASDRIILERWMADRADPPFPINLILDPWD